MTAAEIEPSYEDIAFGGGAVPAMHPDWLASVAWLHGMPVPDVAHARVIELGCGDGGTLLPLALGLPQARFVGIDRSPAHIARATAAARELGLSNVGFAVGDLTTFATDLIRQILDRIKKELEVNVAIKMEETAGGEFVLAGLYLGKAGNTTRTYTVLVTSEEILREMPRVELQLSPAENGTYAAAPSSRRPEKNPLDPTRWSPAQIWGGS